jgi:undecaprenyl diphosphate synthase
MENWNRPGEEVQALMSLLEEYLDKETEKLHRQDIKLTTIGELDLLETRVKEKIRRAKELTKNNTKMTLNIALSYGSRDEIIHAVKNIIQDSKEKKIDINKETFSSYLYTDNMPDPDLLIRTGGEYRISNFLLWQIAYTELYFTKVLWPDFTKVELLKAIASYQRRERRFGMTGEQIKINKRI